MQEFLKCLGIARRDLHAHQDTRQVGPMVAIVEQRNIPRRVHRGEEAQQRTRPLRKLEPIEHLVGRMRRLAAHQVTNVSLRELVGGKVDGVEASLVERIGQLDRLTARRRSDADKDMRFRRIADAVVELGDVALTDDFAEPKEAPRLFGDRDSEDRLALLAVVGALCYK